MKRICISLCERQIETLQELKERTDIGVSDWVRQLLDYSLQPKVLNEIKPTMSGYLSVQGRS
jgi:hypothetical protein